MKNLRSIMACICLSFLGFSAAAQNDQSPFNEPDLNRPMLFKNLPDRIELSEDYINSLFGSTSGRSVNVTTSKTGSIPFEGVVVSTGSDLNDKLQSVIIRSTNFNGAQFTISRYTDADGNVTYNGRILSFRHGDAYVLKNESGNLVLIKKKFYSLVNE